MRHEKSGRMLPALLLVLILVLLAASTVWAGEGLISLKQGLFSSGGGTSTGNGVVIHASIGQSVAGFSQAEDLTLESGYWHSVQAGVEVYLPLVVK